MKLTTMEREWLVTLLDVALPACPGGPLEPSASQAGSVEIFEDMIEYLPFMTALGLRASVWAVELFGAVLGGVGFGRFSKKSPPEREWVLTCMSKSDTYLTRQMVAFLKMIACFGWGADERIRDGLGYNKPPAYVAREQAK